MLIAFDLLIYFPGIYSKEENEIFANFMQKHT